MENRKANIKNMLIKLEVLEHKIQHLESMTDDVLNEVNTQFSSQIKEMLLKKEAALQQLKEIQKIDDDA